MKQKSIAGLNADVPDVIHTVSAQDAKEWFSDLTAMEAVIKLPEPNVDYFYCATKLCSEFPFVNDNGATYEPEDLTEDVLDSLLGVQANLRHDKIGKVVGTIVKRAKVDGGIEIAVRVDREQAAAHNLDPEDMKPGNIYSRVSLEISKDTANSWFYVIDDQYNILKKVPRLEGERAGMRRTIASDPKPYLFQGNKVVERIKPIRFTGVGFVPDPADTQAQVYAVAASTATPERLKNMPEPIKQPEVAAHRLPTAAESQPGTYVAAPEEPNAQHQVHMEPNEHPEYMDVHESDADAMHELACGYM